MQPTELKNVVIDFNRMYNRVVSGKKIPRNWLSILKNSNGLDAMFYSICIAFGSNINTTSSYFSKDGCTNFKHAYIAIERHENSHIHCSSVENYFRASNEMSVEYSISRNLVVAKKKKR